MFRCLADVLATHDDDRKAGELGAMRANRFSEGRGPMLSQSEIYRQKAESFERVAKRLRNRKDPIGRKVFASAERSARRFRDLAKILELLEEQRPAAYGAPASPATSSRASVDLEMQRPTEAHALPISSAGL
jgi:hypothetical protein